jgi:hypothetical protein
MLPSMLCHAESLWSPLYRLYTWKLNYDPKIGDKKCGVIGNVLGNTMGNCGTFFWEHLEEQFGNLGNPLGISWEHDGNRLGTNEKNKKNSPSPKRKTLGHSKGVHAEPSHWLHETFNFQNCLSPLYLAWANIGRGTKKTVGHTILSMQREAICTLAYQWTCL